MRRLLLGSFPPCAAILLAVACVDPPPPSVAPSPRFDAMENVVIAPDTSQHRVDVPMRDRGSMQYPLEERMHDVTAQAITAFIVDTSGRVESGTLKFLGEVPTPAFRRAICDWSRTVRFGTPHVDGRTTRVLFVQPWDFSVGAPSRKPMPNVEGFRTMLQHMTSGDAASWLARMPRCDS